VKVVVVDPSQTVLKIVTGLLAARDHQARVFTDAHEALEYIKSDPAVEALITSAQLTPMPGVELCRKVRQLASRGRPIYVLLMSSNREGQKLIEALDSGADDFIGKPPVVEELYARLRAAARVGTMQRELIHLATTDSLTGLLNRRAFFVQAEEACIRADAHGRLSAVVFDIDHFKRVNDVHGHDIGDAVIRGVAQEAGATRDAILGRIGGEEFAMLLEGRALAEAVAVAEELRLRLSELRFETITEELAVTCSLGVSEWGKGDSIDRLLKRADMALYKAKMDGRNRVATYALALEAVGPARKAS
jgi:diguanylate cyclase (GGDEF)-like protein